MHLTLERLIHVAIFLAFVAIFAAGIAGFIGQD